MRSDEEREARVVEQVAPSKNTSEGRLALLMTRVFFAGLTLVLSAPLFSNSSWLVFVQDDLLYYLKVAQSLAHGDGSTFNSLVSTNGYQPLWFLLLVALSWITTNPRMILLFLACSNLLAALATFILARKLLKASNADAVLVFVFSAWTTLYGVTLFFYGMEVTLTVPLMLGVLCMLSNISWVAKSWTHSFALGLLLSAMVLSRLDTLIFGALLLGGMIATKPIRKLIRTDLILGVLIGLLPVALYFVFNHVVFHTWLPVSGMAKELRRSHLPSIEPWRVFFHPLAAVFTLLTVSAMTIFAFNKHRFNPVTKVLLSATLVFPFVYYFILSCVSDWTLWGWYMYPIRTAVCVSFLVWLSWKPALGLTRRPIIRGALVVSVFVCLAFLRWTKQQTDIYDASIEIQTFAQSHPGVYAMGDRAGRVAYLIPDPVVQTEGLMMDRSYLTFIERQVPLREVLAHYQVRYYVATAYEPFSGCFHAVEPAKAGPDSRKMHAEFCELPVASYLHQGIQTLIYDLKQP